MKLRHLIGILLLGFAAVAFIAPGPSDSNIPWPASYLVGTGPNNLVQLNGSGQLPAVSGALLTNLPSSMVYPGAGIGLSTGSGWGASLIAPASALVGISDSQTLSNKSFGSGMTWPTFNQNTTGTAANLSGTPTLPSGTTLVAPVLGTPASGNLANCTFPTLNQATTASSGSCTGNAATVTNGVYTTGAGSVFQSAPVNTYVLSSTTPTPAAGTTGAEIRYHLGTNGSGTNTGLTAGATFSAPTGTPADGQLLYITILDNGTSRTLAWNAAYLAGTTVSLPTATTAGKEMALGFRYDLVRAGWLLLGSAGGF